MQRKDLTAGMEVAVGGRYGGARRAIVLGQQLFSGAVVPVWYDTYDRRWKEGPRPSYRRGSQGIPLAIHQNRYATADGGFSPERWTFEAAPSRQIVSTWAQFLVDDAEAKARQAKARQAKEAHQAAHNAWRAVVEADLERLGVSALVSRLGRTVTISEPSLERLLELAADGLALRQLDPEGKGHG